LKKNIFSPYGAPQFQAESTSINHGAARVEKATLRAFQAHGNETDVECPDEGVWGNRTKP